MGKLYILFSDEIQLELMITHYFSISIDFEHQIWRETKKYRYFSY